MGKFTREILQGIHKDRKILDPSHSPQKRQLFAQLFVTDGPNVFRAVFSPSKVLKSYDPNSGMARIQIGVRNAYQN